MIVILAVALIVVGPEKLPDLARSAAKWMFELKKTVNQVKDSLAEEENLIDSVQSDLKKTADDLKGNLLESGDTFTRHKPGSPARPMGEPKSDVIDMDGLQPVDEEKEEKITDQEAGEAEQPEAERKPHGQGEGDQPDREGKTDAQDEGGKNTAGDSPEKSSR